MTWGDLSEEASHADVAACVTYLERLLEIDREQLTEQEQLSYDILQQYFEANIAGDALEYYYEPLTQYTGLQVNLPVALWLFEIETEADVKAYLELVADTPRYLAQVLAYEQKRSENGRFMTKSALEAILADLDQIIDAGDKLFLISEFEKSLDMVADLTAEQRAAYREQGETLLSGAFLQAFGNAARGTCRTVGHLSQRRGNACLRRRRTAIFYAGHAERGRYGSFAGGCARAAGTGVCLPDLFLSDL